MSQQLVIAALKYLEGSFSHLSMKSNGTNEMNTILAAGKIYNETQISVDNLIGKRGMLNNLITSYSKLKIINIVNTNRWHS